jgi:hypothetical protein
MKSRFCSTTKICPAIMLTMFSAFQNQIVNRRGVPIILALFVASGSLVAAEAASSKDGTDDLVRKGEQALRVKPPSVTQKSQIAPSGNPNDYASTAPYFWPDPAKRRTSVHPA